MYLLSTYCVPECPSCGLALTGLLCGFGHFSFTEPTQVLKASKWGPAFLPQKAGLGVPGDENALQKVPGGTKASGPKRPR